MLTEFLLDHKWLSPTVLVLLIVLGPFIGAWLVPRSRLAWWLAGSSLLPVVALTLVPVDRQLFERCAVQWSLPTVGRVELMANMVMFVAPVLLAGVATRRPLLVLLTGIALSAVIEAIQAMVRDVGRSCDTTDWLSNALGAVIGAVLAIAALRIASAISARLPQPQNPANA